ncbi:hypothetical protein SDC9_32667 [bioreactor metagenome]|uniref:Uncharacterized protein n=1 Tax=bioreactor metagenome TaxID=1076179 RepID=A0A644V7B6_9ZZZZ|nr:hypothetical protein [Methanocorpusculum sp.]
MDPKSQSWLKFVNIGLISVIFICIGFLIYNFILSKTGFWEWANANSQILSFFATCLMVLVTLMYVLLTREQAKTAEMALKLAEKQINVATQQIQLDKQPCVVVSTSWGHLNHSNNSSEGEWELTTSLSLENLGDSPAISVHVFGKIELLYQKDSPKMINMDANWFTIPYFAAGKKRDINGIFFNSKCVELLIADMVECYRLHPEYRLRESGYHPYGPFMTTIILYKNLLGTWFIGTVKQRISCINIYNLSKIGDEAQHIPSLTSIPICEERIQVNLSFASDNSIEITYQLSSEEEVNKLLSNCSIESEKN